MESNVFRLLSVCFALSLGASLWAKQGIEPPKPKTASEILWSIQKLGTLGKALYVAAHPDDENTSLISYLSLGRKYDTAYLSMTRGDGGQNLIGPEIRDELGVIRTQELLAARRMDGGRQFFTRARDFGYSKNPEETFRIWNKEEVLADVVWIVRKFQPDVIITRFRPEPGYTHGHHTASCILAMEAFEAAADPERFPEQLEFVDTWSAKRVVWNTSSWFFRRSGQEFNESDYVSMDVGAFEPLLGKSFNEIASASRSMHRSQGFGSRTNRGSRKEFFKWLAGESMDSDPFEGVDSSWSRIENGEAISEMISSIHKEFEVTKPSKSIPMLLELRKILSGRAESESWALAKRAEVDAILAECLGLNIMALADARYVQAGDTVQLTIEAINRSDRVVALKRLEMPSAEWNVSIDEELSNNQSFERGFELRLPENLPLPQPYWLRREGAPGLFEVENQEKIGLAENGAPLTVLAFLELEGTELTIAMPFEYREVDPASGEHIVKVLNTAMGSVKFANPVTLFPNHKERRVEVELAAYRDLSGTLEIELPTGWKSSPESIRVDSIASGDSRSFQFEITPSEASELVKLRAVFKSEAGFVRSSMARIEYSHIPEQLVFSDAATRAVNLEVAKKGQKIGYLHGAGDSVPESIREIGFDLEELHSDEMEASLLDEFDTIVLGIRAYNTVDEIDRLMPEFFEFVHRGGTLIVQYNTAHRLLTDQTAPYTLSLSRDRVTDETAEIRILAPDHPVLNYPNKIKPSDFDGWTQERGLYFPDRWHEAFTAVLSCNDPGEPPRNGSLLVAKYGEGYFVYSGISWFRQLPAGVPGAYRLFANMLSLGHQ